MSAAGQWEVVGKPKKEKAPSRPMTKTQIKQFVENMPRIEDDDPVKESHTMFDAFITKDKRADERANNVKANGVSNMSKKVTQPKKKKADPEKKESKPKSLEEAVAKIDKADLQLIFNQSHESFPENPDVWLKDLASFLNLKLERVPENDAVFKDKPKDFPLCKLSKSCQEVLISSMKKCSEQTLEHLFYHCLQTMISEAQKGLATYGYRMFLQSLAFHKPEIPLSKFPQYLDLLKTHHNRPVRCLSILWALGQAGVKRLRCGLRVWLDLMMPALGYRSIAPYCVEYLENLFSWHKEVRPAFGSMSLRDYFQVLDILFNPGTNIQGDLRKRLQAQYPKVKAIAFGENPAKSLRNFFPSFLSRASPSCVPQLKHELLSNLMTCLLTDKQTFSTWCQMYTKHLPQSGVLLEHINSNWGTLCKKVDKKMLRETLRSFSVTNDEIASQNRNVPEGHEHCAVVCRELLLKLSQSPFPWFTLIFSIVLVIGGIVGYDMYTSPSIERSRTVMFLNKYGILAVLQQAWRKIQMFFSKVIGWLRENVPLMYASVYEKVSPYLTQAWRKSSEFVLWTIDSSRPYRQYAVAKTVQAVEWLHALNPDFWSRLGGYLWLCWGLVKTYSLWLWKYILHIAGIVYTWLLQNVLVGKFTPENIHQTTSWSLSVVQNYTVTFVGWCSNVLTQITAN
ncbi:transmembrane protein 214-B-like [Haliotis cracherodii]|uniref:transmembrane protein 214-B-like n=1 Tax=Haliotis cracherodii TaxID=6455 RepID=UPI0039EBBEC9